MRKISAAGFTYVKSSNGIDEFQLNSNNLQVLIMEDHSAPVVVVNITYRVGSRNEVLGCTGATHILEHLMFKGSKHFRKEDKRDVWNLFEDCGAEINGTTWFDRTNYYELLPREYMSKALALEADRMRYALLRGGDLDKEMTVVRNEFERGENDPAEALDKQVWAAAFQAHPYHHSPIGWKSDIENVTIEKLRNFYNTFYWPNNATVSIFGDVSIGEALSSVKKYFYELKSKSSAIPPMITVEPPQEGLRRVLVKRSGEMPIVEISHKIPNGRHKDIPTLQILGEVLTEGRSSRLYKRLVDTGKATRISNFSHPTHDDGLFILFAHLTNSVKPEEVEELILSELKNIGRNGISKKELSKAKASLKSLLLFNRDGVLSVALAVNEGIAAGDWTLYTRMLSNIETVTNRDIKRIATGYFKEKTRTVGYFIPER